MARPKQKRVKYVDLVFENVQSARLTPDMFQGLWVKNITRSLDVNGAINYRKGEVSEYLSCKFFSIHINNVGLDNAKLNPSFDEAKSLRERLRCKDISHVHLYYNDGTEEYIGVPWHGEEYRNHGQYHEWVEQESKFCPAGVKITIFKDP